MTNLFDNGYQLWDNKTMKIFPIFSKTHGKLEVQVDDRDYEMMTLLGKWNVSVLRGRPYVQKRLSTGLIQLHRHLLNAPKGTYVDHIDGNPLNNQRNNLRITTNAANIRNGKIRTNNKSGITGVYCRKRIGCKDKWYSGIKVHYKKLHLGTFNTREEAVKARKEAEVKYFNI